MDASLKYIYIYSGIREERFTKWAKAINMVERPRASGIDVLGTEEWVGLLIIFTCLTKTSPVFSKIFPPPSWPHQSRLLLTVKMNTKLLSWPNLPSNPYWFLSFHALLNQWCNEMKKLPLLLLLSSFWASLFWPIMSVFGCLCPLMERFDI